VDLNGDVKPCLHSGKSLGNIFEKRLNKILRSGIQDHLWHLNKDQIETCNECEFRYCCKHDCIVAANNIGGKLNAKYPFCNYDPYVGEWKNKKGE
jgi:radical SAM protein with 4Fe4S-binding SPASM domain